MQRSASSVRLLGDRLIIRDAGLFASDGHSARRLLERAFSLPEVRVAVIHDDRAQVSIQLKPLAAAPEVWARLGALLREGPAEISRDPRADRLPLRAPAPGLPVRVTRAGRTLTTFRVRSLGSQRMRVAHPLLRLRDVRRRVVDLLRSTHGVIETRPVRPLASVVVDYDPERVDPERLLRLLDDSWALFVEEPRLAPPPTKLVTAGGLLGLAFTAQFFRPALMPWATGAVALYSLPNVVAALRDLRRGRIGLPAMYSVSLGFMLWTGLPFASSLIATLSQLWPALANSLAARSERRLFAEHHLRLASARVTDGRGRAVEVDLPDVPAGAIVWARKGDYLPVDGRIVEGLAAIDETILTGARGAVDRTVGDIVFAGSLVRDGAIAVKAVHVGAATSGAALSRALPQGTLASLPSSAEVERVANRNAKPTLVAAGFLLLATRAPRLSQVVIRPDYATAPRLSTHLSALTTIAESLSRGALIRNPSALDRLLTADVCVFDDGDYFTERAVGLADIFAERGGRREVLALAAAALAGRDDPRGDALRREAEGLGGLAIRARDHHRVAGAILFRDDAGSAISVGTAEFALRRGLDAPSRHVADVLRARASQTETPETRSLVVARDRDILGVLAFDQRGPRVIGEAMSALKKQISGIRFVHLSAASQDEAEARAGELGFDAVFGRLSPAEKAEAMRSLGGVIWIGDGGDRDGLATRAASAVSVSIAGLGALPRDQADIVLLRGDLKALADVQRATARRLGRLRGDYRTVYFANLAAVAGGFAAGFGSLQAGLVSNLGTAAVFLSRWRALSALSARAERAAGERRMIALRGSGSEPLEDRHALFPAALAGADA